MSRIFRYSKNTILFLINLILLISGNAFALTHGQKEFGKHVLDKLLNETEMFNSSTNNKNSKDSSTEDDRESRAMVDALISALEGHKSYSDKNLLSLEDYESALNSQLERLSSLPLQQFDEERNESELLIQVLMDKIEKQKKNTPRVTIRKPIESCEGQVPSPNQSLIDQVSQVVLPILPAAPVAPQNFSSQPLEGQRKGNPEKSEIQALSQEIQNLAKQLPQFGEKFKREVWNVNKSPSGEAGQKWQRFFHEPDGNCALQAISQMRGESGDQTRADFATQLLRKIQSGKSEYYKDMISEDVKEWAERNNIPVGENISTNLIERFIHERLMTRNEYLTIQQGLLGEQIVPKGTLAAAAKIYGLNIRVWRKRNDHKGLEIAVKVQNNPNGKFIDLLHEGIHYDRILPSSDFQERAKYLRYEKEWMQRRIHENQRNAD